MKRLSIIITYHAETPAQIRRAFASVTMQVGINWADLEVLIVGDGVPAMAPALFARPQALAVRLLTYQPSRGAGVARQVGIDHTTGQYLMFIDGDDELGDVFALRELLAATQTTPDMVIARYTKQLGGPTEFHYVPSAAHDWKAAYGKLYNRAYLQRIGLRWRPDLRIFEDTYFVGLACELAQTRHYLNRPVYVWLWNPKSTVRKDHHAFDHQLHTWARSNRYSLAVLRRQKPAVWPRDFYAYLADLFDRQRLYVPADRAAFQSEQMALLVANRQLWTPAGQAAVRQRILAAHTPGGPYAGAAAAGIADYLVSQNQLLKAAFLEAQRHG